MMLSTSVLFTAATFAQYAIAFVSYGDVLPKKYSLGDSSAIKELSAFGGETFELCAEIPLLTLDFGFEIAGFPFFDVHSISAPTQIEVKYAEAYYTLDGWQSDGPFTFDNMGSNNFRVETFNVTSTGRFQSFFIQGGQRWESIRLLTNTTIALKAVGFKSSSDHQLATSLPGRLQTSNQLYNDISDLGAIASENACIDEGNAASTWEITSQGAIIRGQAKARSAKTASFANYTMSFMTKIVRGGTGWTVATGAPIGPVFVLTSNYPNGRTYVNVNESIVPANSLTYTFGQALVNRENGNVQNLTHYPIDMEILEDTWYNISTAITPGGYNISIDGSPIAFVPITETERTLAAPSGSGFSSGSPLLGAIGFGPWQDQVAYVKDVLVTATNGTTMYQNDMRSESTLAEYGVAESIASVCLDGPKRDRLVWIGDFYHTSRIVGATTARWDHIAGTIDYILDWQNTEAPLAGLVPIFAPLGSRPEYADVVGKYGGLLDYQDLFLSSIGEYFRASNNISWVQSRWESVRNLAYARLAFIDPVSGLVAGNGELPVYSYFLGPANGSAVTGLGAYTYASLVAVAQAAGDQEAAETFDNAATGLRQALNEQLWNASLGAFALSLDAPSNFSVAGIAWTILSGAPNATQTEAMLDSLSTLECGVGYKPDTGSVCDETTQLSPNVIGFLLEALFLAHRNGSSSAITIAKHLLDDFWSKMVTQEEYFSGASWEYLHPDGSPGLGDYTSLAHPWGGAPSYVLPQYALGISPTSPGYQTWEFAPLVEGLGLSFANGTVPTPFGDVRASWELGEGCLLVSVSVPQGTRGTLVVPDFFGNEHNMVKRDNTIDLPGGEVTHLKLSMT